MNWRKKNNTTRKPEPKPNIFNQPPPQSQLGTRRQENKINENKQTQNGSSGTSGKPTDTGKIEIPKKTKTKKPKKKKTKNDGGVWRYGLGVGVGLIIGVPLAYFAYKRYSNTSE